MQWTPIFHEAEDGPLSRAGHTSVPISCFSGHKLSTFIVIFGGYNGETSFDDVYIFDTGNNITFKFCRYQAHKKDFVFHYSNMVFF